MTKSRILSKKDNISLDEALGIIAHSRTTQDDSGLLLPVSLVQERRQHCGACGKPFEKNSITGIYYDEKFHEKCIQKMAKGEPPI